MASRRAAPSRVRSLLFGLATVVLLSVVAAASDEIIGVTDGVAPAAAATADEPSAPATTEPGAGTEFDDTQTDLGDQPESRDDAAPTAQLPTPPMPSPDPYAWMVQLGAPGRKFLGVTTPAATASEIDAFATAARRAPDAVMVSRDWANPAFDRSTVERLSDAGYYPIIAWEPWNHALVLSGDRRRAIQPEYSLRSISDGDHDELIRSWAEGAADWGHPLAIRFAHEMNGYWYPWAAGANGNTAQDYVDAWRHVHGIFTRAGADNVAWIWSPNPTQRTLTPLAELWPGDGYVDFVGAVGYLGNGIDPSRWLPTFDELFGPTLNEVRQFTELPIILTEVGATEEGGRKAYWITELLISISGRDDVVGIVWFEIDKEADWRIASSGEASNAFANGVADGSVWGLPR